MKTRKEVMFFCLGLVLGVASIAMADSERGTNTLYGDNAGASITSGTSNTFIGSTAGYSDTTGGWNTFVGQESGFSNTTANTNTFVGQRAGYANTTGAHNTFIGMTAGFSNTTANTNTFVGQRAGHGNTTGEHNTFLGMESGFSNTTASTNTFVGQRAGYTNTEGAWNSFLGQSAGNSNTTGNLNTFIGQLSGYSNETGSYNTFLGEQSGYSNTIGQGNLFLGYRAGYKETGSNKLYIDNSDISTPLIWGDFNTNNVVINGNFRATAVSSLSDVRLKKNIKPLESSLDKISSLQGVSYEWNREDYPDAGMTEGKQIGLVAQDVEKELPELVSEDKDGYKGVSYSKLTAVLVEAVKELKTENQNQKNLMKEQQHQFEKQLGKQQTEIEELRSMIKKLKS